MLAALICTQEHGHMVNDPVCGMNIEPSSAATTRSWRGRTIYFCSARCANSFDRNPAAFHGVAIDPVCEMEIDPEHAATTRSAEGHTFHFCSPTCAETFDRDPPKFARKAEALEQARWPLGRDDDT